MTAQQLVSVLLERSELPPRYAPGGEDDEIETAARHPFNAYEYATSKGQHHEKLWNRVKGSPYENNYRKRFNIRD